MITHRSHRTQNRQRIITLIHVAKNQLNLDENTYRALIEQITGKQSLTELSIPQLNAILDRLKASGFIIKAKSDIAQADDSQSRLIRHLWLLLHAAREVRNPSERALAAYVEKQVHVSALQFLSTDKASQVIERLKKWCDRKNISYQDKITDLSIINRQQLNGQSAE